MLIQIKHDADTNSCTMVMSCPLCNTIIAEFENSVEVFIVVEKWSTHQSEDCNG